MSQTFIIKLQGAKKGSPKKQAEFIRSEEHDCHIYQGKEFPLEELNDLYPKVLEEYKTYEYYAPVPHIVTKRYPNMEKARAALKEIEAKKQGEEAPTKKAASKKATRKKAAT